ncbi:MAG: LTA synthase family protein [Planctomycetota bacterium]
MHRARPHLRHRFAHRARPGSDHPVDPPTPGRSIVKRPGCDSLDSIGWALKDHGVKATFLYGGYGYFDNMNFFFSTNGFHVVDRADLAEDEVRFANAWGVCDEDMLARSIKEARADHAAGQRFFQLVMTTSNHRPYTYPQVVDIPSGSGRDGAVQYTDFAIGTYLDAAAAEPWFVDTLFVITGDHCASSAGKRALNIEKHHIPLLLYAPGQMPAQRISTLGSQIDIAPTLIGLLDIEHTAQWFGHDLQRGGPPRAFVGNYQTLGLFDGQNLGYLAAAREGGCLAVDANLESDNAPFPEDLRKRTIAFYQVASHLYDSGALKLTGRVHDRVRR